MSHSQAACKKIQSNIEANVFKEVDGFYLDPKSPVYKQVFKNWPEPSYPLADWQKTGGYMNSYDKYLREGAVRAKKHGYSDLVVRK